MALTRKVYVNNCYFNASSRLLDNVPTTLANCHVKSVGFNPVLLLSHSWQMLRNKITSLIYSWFISISGWLLLIRNVRYSKLFIIYLYRRCVWYILNIFKYPTLRIDGSHPFIPRQLPIKQKAGYKAGICG